MDQACCDRSKERGRRIVSKERRKWRRGRDPDGTDVV